MAFFKADLPNHPWETTDSYISPRMFFSKVNTLDCCDKYRGGPAETTYGLPGFI